MSIKLELTPEEAHNNVVFIDLALKHPDGGVKILNAAKPILDKIKAAVALANEKEKAPPAADTAGDTGR